MSIRRRDLIAGMHLIQSHYGGHIVRDGLATWQKFIFGDPRNYLIATSTNPKWRRRLRYNAKMRDRARARARRK